MENYETTCRVCLESSIEINNFSIFFSLDSQKKVFDCFNLCTNLKASESDGLTTRFCNKCLKDLRSTYSFIQKAHKSDKILREKQIQSKSNSSTFVTEYGVEETYDEIEDSLNDDMSQKIVNINIQELCGSETGEIIYVPESTDIEIIEDADLKESSSCEKNTIKEHPEEHNNKVKSNIKKITLCSICGITCSSSSLKSHLRKHEVIHPMKCNHCNKSFITKSGLNLHLAYHKTGKTAKFLCSICGQNFLTNQRLNDHITIHTGEKKFSCSTCLKKFRTIYRLRNHVRSHTGERPFECKTCGVKFTQTNALKCHERIHTGEKPYECNICGRRFTQNASLKTHMALHTGKTVECPNCDKKFSRPSHLILHQREHTGEKPYACDKCPNRYKQKSHLDLHMDTHLGVRHPCPECGKKYTKRSSLRIHMFKHSQQKPYECINCNMTFIRKDRFHSHLRTVHENWNDNSGIE